MMLLLGLAHAQGYSMDIELVQPSFSPDSLPGVASAQLLGAGSVRVGTLFQYEHNPLVLYRFDERMGAVIVDRSAFHLGAELDFSDHVAARLMLPMAIDGSTEVAEFAGPGFGVGDLVAGVRFGGWSPGAFHLGARTDIALPVGTRNAWIAEESLRFSPGFLASVDVGRWSLLTDTGLVLRQATETGEDFYLGQELHGGIGVRCRIMEDRLDLSSTLISRASLKNIDEGGAQNVEELLVGLTTWPQELLNIPAGSIKLDLLVGKGLSPGYGTTAFRGGVGLTWSRIPAPPEPVATVAITPIETVIPEDPVVVEPEPEPVWQPQELARVEQDQIVIRDPIQFELGTDVILPVSLPTLEMVAQIMKDHPEILHVVIEGHASEEGTYLYNYDLSLRRASSIFRELIRAGVHPSRLSCRAMGEVQPVNMGTDEVSLAENRRVVFHIARRLATGEALPPYAAEIRAPWSGEPVVIPPPPPLPEPPAPPPPPPPPGDLSNPDIFEEEEE